MEAFVPCGWLDEVVPDTEMGRLVATYEWASTPLGDPNHWPEPLRTVVGVVLRSPFPMLVTWGPELIKIYNDAYRVFLGDEKHPAALGSPARDVWPEIWDTVEPLFDSVVATGQGTWAEHERLLISRNGFLEETYFTFAYSPIYVWPDVVGGVLDVVTETTDVVVGARRLRGLGELASALVAARDVTDVCRVAVDALVDQLDELPSAKIRLWAGDELVPVATNDRHLVHNAREVAVLARLEPGDLAVLDPDWVPGRPAHHVAVGIGGTAAKGVLSTVLNPHRPFDDAYREFVELVGRTIGGALETAFHRSSELGEHRRISETLQRAMLPRIGDRDTIAARYVPAVGELAVGGDWYDVAELEDGRRGLVVGDCVGHGLEAAAVMSQLRSVSRALLLEGRSPAEVVDAMDRLAGSIDGALGTTMVCAVVDDRNGTLTFAVAGHPPPLLLSSRQGTWLDEVRHVPLGVAPGSATEATVELRSGDLLILYTDGLVERRGESIDVGLVRLRELAEADGRSDPATMADRLIEGLLADRPADDVALIVWGAPDVSS